MKREGMSTQRCEEEDEGRRTGEDGGRGSSVVRRVDFAKNLSGGRKSRSVDVLEAESGVIARGRRGKTC